MKSTEEIVYFLEKELSIIGFENLNISKDDKKSDIEYKQMQKGKRIAYGKILSFLKDAKIEIQTPQAKNISLEIPKKNKPITICK